MSADPPATVLPALSSPLPIPTPPRLPVLGNLLQMPRGRLTQHLMTVSRDFDGIFAIDFAGLRVPFVSSARLAAELCDEKRFRKTIKPPLSILRALAGDGLFTAHSDEPNWGKAHRVLVPAFAQRARRAYFDAMLEVASQLVNKWSSSADRPLEVSSDMTRLTLDTIALCGFGYRFDSFGHAELHPFLQAMGRVLDETMGRLTRHRWLSQIRLPANRRYERDIAAMHALVDEVIRERRAHPLQSRDLLGLMLEAVDPVTGEQLDDANIRYQVITFLIAGHETTSGLLSFVLQLLTRHPEVLTQARNEVDRVLADGRAPDYDDLARFEVIDRVLKETLRLWPTAPAFAVAPFKDTLLDGRYLIRRDQRVTLLLPALHRDPSIWPNPEAFDIDRFLPQNEARIPSAAYKPFGNGQRSCIGRQFAVMEAKLALAMILQKLEFEDADPQAVPEIRETLTLKPAGFRVRVRRRAPAWSGAT